MRLAALSISRKFPARGVLALLGGLVLAGTLAACGHNYYPSKGDSKPHPGVARAHSMPIHGIDVSRHQGTIDWQAVARAGTRFAFIKATDGGDHLDPRFHENWRKAREAGIPRGAYHFVYWCRPASEQVAWFAANVRGNRCATPVLDLEWNNEIILPPLADPRGSARVHMLAGMEAHTGKVPIIYTDINFTATCSGVPSTPWLHQSPPSPMSVTRTAPSPSGNIPRRAVRSAWRWTAMPLTVRNRTGSSSS